MDISEFSATSDVPPDEFMPSTLPETLELSTPAVCGLLVLPCEVLLSWPAVPELPAPAPPLVAELPSPLALVNPLVAVSLTLPVALAPILPGMSITGDEALLLTPFDPVLPIADAVRLQLI